MKPRLKRLILYIIIVVIMTITFNLGIVNNPDFRVGDFFVNLSSEFIGLVFALCVVEVYIHERIKARGNSSRQAAAPSSPVGAVVYAVIYDCEDPGALACFYATLLGGTVETDPYGGCTVKAPGLAVELGFQADEHYCRPVFLGETGDQQPMAHIDIRVPDRDKAVEYALSIGATRPREQVCQPDWPVQWVTLLDPAGHPFCLFEE